MPAKSTKTSTIIRLLRRPKGASIVQLQRETGWQPHSVRAALTGIRKQGIAVTRDKNDAGITVYRVAPG